MSAYSEVLCIAVLAAAACAVPGTFLVLRGMSMMADAITHTVFLGIVLAFFATADLNSPWLLLGAAATGVFTVWCTETLYRTRLVAEDASIGVVFPLFFSAGIILVNLYSGNAHLDVDTALLGEIAFAPFDRFYLGGTDMGPAALWTLLFVGLLNSLVVGVLYKEMKLASFDALLAACFGFSPVLLHYLLMTLVSVTVVASFQAVGAILVIGLMIGPPATAYLLTDHLSRMLFGSAAIGAVCALVGTRLAMYWDVSIAGAIAATIGVVFLITVVLAPKTGILAGLRNRRRLRVRYAQAVLLRHLHTHEGTAQERTECGIGTLHEHLRWEAKYTMRICRTLQEQGDIRIEEAVVRLTEQGRQKIADASRFLYM